MTKKKNTLKDLDEFLKQQATTLVAPPKLSDRVEEPKAAIKSADGEEALSLERIQQELKMMAVQEPQFREKLYSLIISSVENQSESLPADKMLINTALYLKSGENWKEVIREYWRKS